MAEAFLYIGLGELELYLVAAVDLFHVGIGHGVLFLIEAVNLGVALCNAFLQPVHLSAGVVVLRGHYGGGVLSVLDLSAPPPLKQLNDALHAAYAAYYGQYLRGVHAKTSFSNECLCKCLEPKSSGDFRRFILSGVLHRKERPH